jgi:hypothetical protein
MKLIIEIKETKLGSIEVHTASPAETDVTRKEIAVYNVMKHAVVEAVKVMSGPRIIVPGKN